MGMFDSIQCNYPLPLPLEVIDILPDPYDQEFQTKDLENLLENYILSEDGELIWVRKKYKWIDDDEAFLKGYLDIIEESNTPTFFHGLVNFYLYETIYDPEDETKAKDVSIDYLAKFTDGKLDSIIVLDYEITDASSRIYDLKNTLQKQKELQKLWYNKYIFHTKFWKFIKWKIIIKPINLIKKLSDKVYWAAVKNL